MKLLATAFSLALAIAAFAAAALASSGSPEGSSGTESLAARIRAALAERHPGAAIELGPELRFQRGSLTDAALVRRVEVLGESGRGTATVRLLGDELAVDAVVPYTARRRVWTSARRLGIGTRLEAAQLSLAETDVALGQAFAQRSSLLGAEDLVDGAEALETRQTVLEGTPLTRGQVQAVPDIRRGQAVEIRVISGGLRLSTRGTAEESARTGDSVRVISGSTKRTLGGTLLGPGLVEVRL